MYYIIPGKAIRKLEKMALNFQEGIDFEYMILFMYKHIKSLKSYKNSDILEESLLGII